jgi:beta-mannosidase
MHVKLVELTDSLAWMDAVVELANDRVLPDVIVKVGESFRQIRLCGKDTTVHIPFQVVNPRLWWPNNMGDQHLYEFKSHAYVNGYLIDSVSVHSGIRSSELVMEPDSIGTSFYFRINDSPVFIQGANYVPNGHFPGQEGDDKRLQLLKDAAAVGMNMIRVWGGGVYEDDRFYEICDSLGLMVWQDFMFACAMYPSDADFVENVKQEVSNQLLRLRNHPSVVLFCGNNESDVAWKNWGWQQQYGLTPTDSITIRKGYEKLFMGLIPDLVSKLAPTTPYVHTSPLSNWGKRQNFNHLNMHYWGVWHGEEPIDSFRVNVPRFMSEYGMQSYPSFSKLLLANGGTAPDLSGGFMTDRQKSYKGNKLLIRYIEQRYGIVKSSDELSYLSQLHQVDAMAMAIESHRLNFGRCMGTLFWQLNDVWDGASWSTIESDGKWKAAHCALKRLYGRSIILVDQTKDSLHVYVQLHQSERADIELKWELLGFFGEVFGSNEVEKTINGQQASKIISIPLESLLQKRNSSEVFLNLQLYEGDTITATKMHLLVLPKQLRLTTPAIKCISKGYDNGQQQLQLSSDRLALGVMVELPGARGNWTQNYFNLLPNRPVVVSVPMASESGCERMVYKSYLPSIP